MKGDEIERGIEDSASTPSEAAAAIFFYRRGDATTAEAALRCADELENALDQRNMVIANRLDLALNQRDLIGRRVVWRHPNPEETDKPRRYGVLTRALVNFDEAGEWGVGEGDDLRLVVKPTEAAS